MIRNPDFDTFVCCAVCSKLIPPPPRRETYERIREYKPFKTRYYTHKDILDVGADIKEQEAERREQEVQKRIEKVQKKLLYQAEKEKEEAVDDALIHAAALHKQDLEELKKKHEQELQVAVMNTRTEMLKHLEVELKRESEAAEQRMTHKLQRLMLEISLEKMAAVAEARDQERSKTAEALAKQQMYCVEQLRRAGTIANEIYQKNLKQLAWEQKHEMEIAFTISQKEYQEETEKLLKAAEAVREAQLEQVVTQVNEKDTEIFSLYQKLEYITKWKDSLEAEIVETREAFQKYIDVTFPQLAPGQAHFILPFRISTEFTASGVDIQGQ
ncbi:uncharacterized protein C6orf163 homolog isoform X1 [Sphaerodactylus townsendi]|uniref:uncharacterized protein C6orf163 homolog isoform X1 n=1 Tax=Sphaerodactylus townsendi TaxID=933632 RepID=UPI0020273A46|nr:uncharacterized protein C6orf163 homolog isoform X1 [Sphaerodactylus townsendi]